MLRAIVDAVLMVSVAGMITLCFAWGLLKLTGEQGDAPTMKPRKLPPVDSVDDTAVRAFVAHIVGCRCGTQTAGTTLAARDRFNSRGVAADMAWPTARSANG
jgi:hypothetical protein